MPRQTATHAIDPQGGGNSTHCGRALAAVRLAADADVTCRACRHGVADLAAAPTLRPEPPVRTEDPRDVALMNAAAAAEDCSFSRIQRDFDTLVDTEGLGIARLTFTRVVAGFAFGVALLDSRQEMGDAHDEALRDHARRYPTDQSLTNAQLNHLRWWSGPCSPQCPDCVSRENDHAAALAIDAAMNRTAEATERAFGEFALDHAHDCALAENERFDDRAARRHDDHLRGVHTRPVLDARDRGCVHCEGLIDHEHFEALTIDAALAPRPAAQEPAGAEAPAPATETPAEPTVALERLVVAVQALWRHSRVSMAEPMIPLIMAELGRSEAVVRKGLKAAVAAGLLERRRLTHDGKRFNHYVVPPSAAAPAAGEVRAPRPAFFARIEADVRNRRAEGIEG